MDAKLSPEENIAREGFWKCFWTRLFKLVLDLVHIRSIIFWMATGLASRFMAAFLEASDKSPNPWVGVSVVAAWFLLAVGVGWHRTWELVWKAAAEALDNYSKKGSQS